MCSTLSGIWGNFLFPIPRKSLNNFTMLIVVPDFFFFLPAKAFYSMNKYRVGMKIALGGVIKI